jgi:hypothetical protein
VRLALAWSTEADRLAVAGPMVAGEGILLTQLYGAGGEVAYAHFDQSDAGVVLGDGAAPTPFTLVPNANPIALALDDANVYWADFGAGEIAEAPKSGGPPVVLWSSSTTQPRAIAVDPTNVYVVASGSEQGTSEIMAVPIAGGAVSTFASSPALLTGPIVAGPSAVHWVDGAVQSVPKAGGAVNSFGPGSVGYVPIAGGLATVLASGRPASIVAIAVDDRNVYWVEREGTIQQGAIAAVPKTGGQVAVLVSGLSDPMSTAVDPSGVYFRNAAGGIGKIAK